MIPKKIHYCWFGGNPLPKSVLKCMESWKKYCPDYEIIQWNESNFDVNSHPFMKAAYENKAWAFVSDYARLKVIYDEGGIYLDTDVELLKNLDFLLNEPCYFGMEQSYFCNTGLGFGAQKNSEIISRMMKIYDVVQFDQNRLNALACPKLNTPIILEEGYNQDDDIWRSTLVTVFPPRYFDPLAPGDARNLLCEDTISIHHYSATWTDEANQRKRRLHNFVGEERILKVKDLLRALRKR